MNKSHFLSFKKKKATTIEKKPKNTLNFYCLQKTFEKPKKKAS